MRCFELFGVVSACLKKRVLTKDGIFNLDLLGRFDGKTGPIFMGVCGKVVAWMWLDWEVEAFGMLLAHCQFPESSVSRVFVRMNRTWDVVRRALISVLDVLCPHKVSAVPEIGPFNDKDHKWLNDYCRWLDTQYFCTHAVRGHKYIHQVGLRVHRRDPWYSSQQNLLS